MKKTVWIIILAALTLSGVKAQPLIGVSANTSESDASVGMSYINAIRNAGGVPVIIPWTTDRAQLNKIFSSIDALVMTGGDDVDPLRYYGEEPLRQLGEVCPERDSSDYLFIKTALEQGLPVLAICRGEQMLNVVAGGSLFQDIPSQLKTSFVKHSQKAPSNSGTHTITIDKKSLLFKILGKETLVVNSFHHQAVKDIAPGFKVVALSRDSVVEAIESTTADNVIGVQFHPEKFACQKGETQFLQLFTWLVEQAER